MKTPPAGERRGPNCQCINGMLYAEDGDIAACIGEAGKKAKAGGRTSATGKGRTILPSELFFTNVCDEREFAAPAPEGPPLFDVRWRDAALISLPAGSLSVSQQPTKIFIPIGGAAGAVGETAAGLSAPFLMFGSGWKGSDPYGMLNAILDGSPGGAAGTDGDSSVNELYRGGKTGIAIAVGETTTVVTVHVPPSPPTLAVPGNAVALATGRVRFAWEGASGATSYRIQVSPNPQFSSTVTDVTTAITSYQSDTVLASGVYYWRVRAIDSWGGNGEWSAAWSVTIDADPPYNTTAGRFINNGAAMTSALTVTLAISARKWNGVTGYHISEKPATPPVGDSGWVVIRPATSFSASIPYVVSKGDGKKTVYVRFRDAIGNVSRAKSEGIVVDTVLPDTGITGQPPTLTNSTSAVFGVTATEPGSAFQCSLDDGPYSACTRTASYSGLIDGPHSFRVKATDAAGNIDPSPAAYTWTIDTTLPRTAITSQPRIWTNVTSAIFSFSSPKAGVTFQCRLDDGPYAACISPLAYAELPQGSHTFMVMATDAAGNVDPAPAGYTWTIDTTPFGTAITNQPPDPSPSASAEFSVTSKKEGTSFQCKLNKGVFTACASMMTYTGLTDGEQTFTVKAVDALGNEDTTPASYSWIVSLPPTNETPLSFINKGGAYLTDKATVKLTIAAKSKKGVKGYFASESPIPPEADSQGWAEFKPVLEFSRIVPFTMSDSKGTKTVYVWFKDVEGNVSEAKSDTIYLFNSNYLAFVFILFQVATIIAL